MKTKLEKESQPSYLGVVKRRFLCFFGAHRMRIGLGWSRNKRYDTCLDCRHSVWIEDIEGNKKVNAQIQKHIDSKSV